MQVPSHLAVLRRIVSLPLLLLLAAAPVSARTPPPSVRIPLAPLGFQPLIQEFLLAGSSLLTLHFVDDTHLLLTFNTRTLLKRIPNDPPGDMDRNVAALLIELPSGRVLARTDWRLHDHGQYLWPLGQGRFLLRIRDTLTTFAPLANLHAPEPFQQRRFLNTLGRRVGYLFLSPEADFLTVESKPAPTQFQSDAPSSVESAESTSATPVQFNFYRISIPPGPGDEVGIRSAGGGRSRNFGNIVLTTAGHLDIIDQGHQSWAFNFDTFAGVTKELAAFDSTCRPLPVFVSHSEFIVFGCHNGDTRQVLGGFNMRGDEMWEQGLFGDYIAPYLAFSPSSGRFALGRVMASGPLPEDASLSADLLSSQTVVVYQAHSGSQLLKVDCSPIERAGQNFALSPDGLNLGVVHADAVEIYSLPPLTQKEKSALQLAQAAAPPVTDLPVRLSAATSPPTEAAPAPTTPVPATQSASTTPSAQPAPQPASPPAPPQKTSGDPQPDQPRKPPTLYTLPTDPPHSQSK